MRDEPKKVHRESPKTGAGKEEWMPLDSPPYRFAEQSDSLQKQAADAAAVVNGSHEGIRRTKISGAAFFHPFLYR
ncbi:hypothetical protein FEF65_06720 [Mariprofundus erugo]|uniref:Uncharacterized protein n=1 Tax=Mariprofundus erugo TaxID=2528639 RepID=A0A5R9GNN0_9PROT|nr:hypothetical protein FEF65_06720 [Mariprofundus erugo]